MTSQFKRKSMRLKNYDYSCVGTYFVTVCVQGKQYLFGDIVGGGVQLNSAGKMIKETWLKLPEKYSAVTLDEYIVMSNHFHGIILISDQNVGANPCVRPNGGQTRGSTPTLGRIIQWFKTMTTNGYIHGVKQFKRKSFKEKLWQRNYYEHVVRNENESHETREYIQNNPLKWDTDSEK